MDFSRLAVALLVVSAASGAGAYDFTGLGIGIEVQLKATGSRDELIDTSNGEDFRFRISSGGEQDVIGGVDLNYGIYLAPDFTLLTGATANFGSTDVALLSSSLMTPTGSVELNGTVKEKNHFSIYLAPGYVVAPETLLYLKLAFHRMTLESSESFLDPLGAASTESSRLVVKSNP